MQIVLRQLVREFWIPAVIAVLWTSYNSLAGPAPSIPQLIAGFSGSFFLASWATGQFNRVKKQVRVEESFSEIKKDISKLLEDIDASTQRLEGYSTGGKSFCFIAPMWAQDNVQSDPGLVHQGDYPVQNIRAWVFDPREFQIAAQHGSPHSIGYKFDWDYLTPQTSKTISQLGPIYRDLDVHFGAKNGLWTQMIKVRGQQIAYAVVRGRSHPAEILTYQYPAGFPLIGDELFDERIRGLASSV